MYLNGECFVIRRGYETTLPVSTSFCLTVPLELLKIHVTLPCKLKTRIRILVDVARDFLQVGCSLEEKCDARRGSQAA